MSFIVKSDIMFMESSNEVKFDVVKTITEITKKLENSKLNDKVIEKLKKPLFDLSNYLDVATNQAIIFSIFFVLQVKEETIDLRDIIRFLDISYIDTLNFKNDFDILLEKNLIEIEKDLRRKSKKSTFFNTSYSIPSDVSDSIYCNQKYSQKIIEKIDIYEFVRTVSNHIDERGDDQINTNELFNIIEQLEVNNEHIEPIEKIKSFLEIDDRTLLYQILSEKIVGFPCYVEKTLRDIYQNPRKRLFKIRELIEKTNKMFDIEYITLGDSKFVNDFTLNLTSKAIELLMEKDAELFMSNNKYKNLLLNEDIKYKELFYEQNLTKEINFLTTSLDNDNFIKLQNRLTNNSLPHGLTAIFYGTPGTGKTETVYQIAKTTGRDILLVDISQSKSMWFGESEKLIKEIFETYKKICNNEKTIPILLFNEADAILNKRQENGSSNVGQTENAIQNILLEEIEKFDGILIATTNLEGNLDAAYERRFLFKIKFESPTVEVKSKIWKSKISWIDSDFAQKLANEFSFSGGEIDNIVRKIIMNEVLIGKKPEESEIYSYCKNEKQLSVKNKIIVGYV